jgi:hypothetical protein
MFYYLSVILLPLMMASGSQVSEKSMTGPFETKEQCELYKLSIENTITQMPNVELTKSVCEQNLAV